MKLKALLAVLLFSVGCFAQSGSPYNQTIYPAQFFTATSQTGAAIQLNGQTNASTIGSSYGAGTITVTATTLTTATFAVMGSSDNGKTYFALPITPVAAGSSAAGTATATANGLYQVSLVGITHVKFVTSGTFTATGLSLTLTATPNVTISHAGGSSGGQSSLVANLPGSPHVVYTFTDQAGTTVKDSSGNSLNGTINRASDGGNNYWTGTGLTFGAQSAQTQLAVPAANLADQTYCFAVYIPYYGNTGQNNINGVLMMTDTSNHGWSATANFVYGAGVYQDVVVVNSNTQAALPLQETGYHTKCLLFQSGQNDRLFLDGVEISYQSRSNINAGFQTGNWYLGLQTGAQDTITYYYYASWAAVLTPAQIQQASFAMTQAVSARGVPIVPPSIPTAVAALHTQGDSITCCAGASTTEWYPSLLSLTATYTVLNEGMPGFPVMSFAEAARWRDTPSCNSGGSKSLVTIFGGTNDGLFGASAAVTFAAIQADVNILTSYGCQVGVATMLSRTGLDTFKDQLNPLIRTGAANGGYFLIDTASSTFLGADGAYANTTYFNTDQTHPTNAGQVILGALFSNAINAYGNGAASLSNPTVYSSNTVTMVSGDRVSTIIPTGAATATLPDCLGVTGTRYQVFNASAGANTITFSGKASEAITGSATLAQNTTAIFQAQLISQAAAGCGWLRAQ